MDNAPPKRSKKQKRNLWPVKVFFLTFLLAALFSFFSKTMLMGVNLTIALLVLLLIILIGILFDIIGIAVTYQDITAYTAMASKKMRGAKQAIRLVQSASTVSNICNDVVGDICGIISGAMGAAIALRLLTDASNAQELLISILISSLIAAVTVGGKAAGKRYAMRYSRQIVFLIGRLFSLFSRNEKNKR